MDCGINDLLTTKCTKCQKEIGSNTNQVFLIGGWPFCKVSCVENNQMRIAWSRKRHNRDVLYYGEAKLADFECVSKEPYGGPVDEN